MKSAIAFILCSCLVFNAEAQGGREGKLDVFTDGTNTAFRVVVPDSDRELRKFGGFSVGYHLLIDVGGDELATPLLLPEVDVPSPGMMTLSYVVNRVWPEGTRFSAYLYDRDGNMLDDAAAKPEAPLKMNWQGTVSPYESLRGAKRIGRTPSRHANDIAKSPLGIGYETLDRCTFDPKWTFKLVAEAGVKWARCQTGWIRCEREKGVYDFSWLDEVVDGLSAEGVETWFSVSFGNPLYTPNDKFANALAKAKAEGVQAPGWARGYVGEAPAYHGEEAMDGWKRYVSELARHFKGRVRVWEVWNEPEGFWRDHSTSADDKYGTPKAARDFASFVHTTADVIRGEIPDARISFNLAELSSGWIPALAAAGVGEFVDIFNYHGYDPYPEAALDSMLGQVKALFRKPDGTPLEIWQGESGRATDKANNGVILPTQYSQARFIARRVATDLAHGAKVCSIFTVTDFLRYYPDGRDQFYGVLDGKTHKPKHGWYTLQCLGWLCDGLEPAPEIFVYFSTEKGKAFTDHLPYAAVKTAAFRRKGVPVVAAWQPQHVELNAQPLCGQLRFVVGEKAGALPNPILIDPVRCEVWDVSELFSATTCGIEIVHPFYALDYPLFLTDRSVLEEM